MVKSMMSSDVLPNATSLCLLRGPSDVTSATCLTDIIRHVLTDTDMSFFVSFKTLSK